MADVEPSTSCSKDPVELMGEASCSGADHGSTSAESVPPSIATSESPSFLTWMCIQIVTACSGVVWGVRGGPLSGSRVLGRASGAQQHSLEDSESEVSSRMAASKSTWSEVPVRRCDSVSIRRPNQLPVWEELKESAPDFFRDDWGDYLQVGRLIAEGDQARIYEAEGEGTEVMEWVLNVFKLDAGFLLADLKRHWPCSVRKNGHSDCGEYREGQERRSGFVFDDFVSNAIGDRCQIAGATSLKDRRFAFVMRRYWGDLRTLIDLKVEEKTHSWEFDFLSKRTRSQPPFSFEDSIYFMLSIARGMQGLHALGVLHRDLKAANVLMEVGKGGSMYIVM